MGYVIKIVVMLMLSLVLDGCGGMNSCCMASDVASVSECSSSYGEITATDGSSDDYNVWNSLDLPSSETEETFQSHIRTLSCGGVRLDKSGSCSVSEAVSDLESRFRRTYRIDIFRLRKLRI